MWKFMKKSMLALSLFGGIFVTAGCTDTSAEEDNQQEVASETKEETQAYEEKIADKVESREDNQEEPPSKGEPKQAALHGVKAVVTRVVDGDTIEVKMNGKEEDVRLLLIDTPETVHPSEPVQPFGPEASAFAKQVLQGKTVEIQVGKEKRDHYGRLLSYVWIGDTTFQEMILKKGLARTAYLYNDLTMLDEFHEAQDIARSKGIGVWSIEGYAHVDHNHGYHYEEKKEVAKVEPTPKQTVTYEKDPWGADIDCSELSSQFEAQEIFDAVPGDPHDLDRDGDMKACDSL